MENLAIDVQSIRACTLAGIWLSSQVDVRDAGENGLFTFMHIFLCLCLIIYMLNSIIGVEMVDIVGGDGVSGFASSFGRSVILHEGGGEL